MKRMIVPIGIVLTALLVLVSCNTPKPLLKLVYVEWASEMASVNVIRAVIEEYLDHEVAVTPVSVPVMYSSVASGEADAMVAAWLPDTHRVYFDEVKGRVTDLGPNLVGTRTGLVVPAYVPANDTADLAQYIAQFNGEIVGIDPEAGIMTQTKAAMETYGLTGYRLTEGSGAEMTERLEDAIARNAWIVVTGWTPHWMFLRWNLKYLADSRGAYGGVGYIHTIVRKGLEVDYPDVYRFLNQFYWTVEDMQEVMQLIQESDKDPYEVAKEWVAAHPEKRDEWLRGIRY